MSNVKKILKLRAAGSIERCHIIPHHGSYSVAEHIGHGLKLLLQLHPNPTMSLVQAWTFHDSSELATGDVPAPVKMKNPDLAKILARIEDEFNVDHDLVYDLNDEDVKWLKSIDLLELYLWCCDQMMLGNSYAEYTAVRIRQWIRDTAVDEVIAFVNEEYLMNRLERCFF